MHLNNILVIFTPLEVMSIKKEQASLFEGEEQGQDAALVPASCMSVLVPYPVDKAYTYGVADGMDVKVGDYVSVPLGGREVPAVVWGAAVDDVPLKKLKYISYQHELQGMADVTRQFIDWVSHYTMAAKGSVLKMALSVPSALDPPKPVKAYKIGIEINEKTRKGLSPQRQKVLEVLSDGHARRPSEIADLAGVSAAVVTGMAKKNLLRVVEIFGSPPCRNPDPYRGGAILSQDQQCAADVLCGYFNPVCLSRESGDLAGDAVKDSRLRGKGNKGEGGGFHAALLDGVTGAGKTEVYFEAVAQALKDDKQVLILLPEIALSNAFLDRFKARFGCAPALWHSALSAVARRNTWRGVAQGEVKVVIGARSALFLPYSNLGLIVVDEEHDPAYKQEEGVMYHARDMAVVRASMGKFPIVLVSATPSLETMQNAWDGRYEHLLLADRFGGARLPDIDVIDMRQDKPERQHFIAPSLIGVVEKTLAAGEQALLFLNRRGYAPLTLCRSCGHRMDCPRCTAWLVEHKSSGRLHCHHCGFACVQPQNCPECDDKDSFAVCGPGVERIMEEARAAFPDANIMMLTSDTAENNEVMRGMLDDIKSRKVDIIIGTQIIAKGHHFPHLTCVGVIDADLGLQGGDLRAAERVYQLLHQVAGRAGREDKKGHVYLQSFMPNHPIMKALMKGSRDEFLAVEASEREAAHMPPFSRLVGVIVSGREEAQVVDVAKALGACAPQGESVQTFGPAPAVFARLRGKFRYRLLVRSDKAIDIQKTIAAWVGSVKKPSTVRVQIDIDPQSFM